MCECKFPWPLAVHKKKGERPSPTDPIQYYVHEPNCSEFLPNGTFKPLL